MTAADFLNKFPEFQAVDETRIKLSLDEAKLQVTEKIWGRFYEVGVLVGIGSLMSVRFGVALAQKIDRTVQKRCLLALICTTLIIMINKLFA